MVGVGGMGTRVQVEEEECLPQPFFCLVNGHPTHRGTLREVPIILAQTSELGVVHVLILPRPTIW